MQLAQKEYDQFQCYKHDNKIISKCQRYMVYVNKMYYVIL